MIRPLTHDDSSRAPKRPEDEPEGRDATFVRDWQERRKHLTLIQPGEPRHAAREPEGELRSYISRFVRTWQERQERLTLNQAAIKKAECEWQAEQEKAREEARSKRVSERQAE